jgi:hypothetical protein
MCSSSKMGEKGGDWRQSSSHFPCLNSMRGGKPSLRDLENLHIGSERAPYMVRGVGWCSGNRTLPSSPAALTGELTLRGTVMVLL